MLRDTPKKPHAVAEVKRMRERLEPRTVVARAGDLERCLPILHRREGSDRVMNALVLLEASEVRESRARAPCLGRRTVSTRIDAGVNHLDVIARDPPPGEVVGGALADRLERNVPVNPGERAFGEPHGRGERGGELLKDRSTKEVRH